MNRMARQVATFSRETVPHKLWLRDAAPQASATP
jgi:hypothetical protein